MVDQHPEEWRVLSARAAVEQDPQKLIKLVTRINDLLDQKRARLLGKHFQNGSQVFQIAYDEILLITRAELLELRGYQVQSALGNEDAKRILANGGEYRVFLIGHQAPRIDREAIVNWLRSMFPKATLIAITTPGEDGIPGAHFNFVLNGPEGWLAAIVSALGSSRQGPARPESEADAPASRSVGQGE